MVSYNQGFITFAAAPVYGIPTQIGVLQSPVALTQSEQPSGFYGRKSGAPMFQTTLPPGVSASPSYCVPGQILHSPSNLLSGTYLAPTGPATVMPPMTDRQIRPGILPCVSSASITNLSCILVKSTPEQAKESSISTRTSAFSEPVSRKRLREDTSSLLSNKRNYSSPSSQVSKNASNTASHEGRSQARAVKSAGKRQRESIRVVVAPGQVTITSRTTTSKQWKATSVVVNPSGKVTVGTLDRISLPTVSAEEERNSSLHLDEYWISPLDAVIHNQSGRSIQLPAVPPGYTIEIRFRQSGEGAGRHYLIYHTPKGRKLRTIRYTGSERDKET